MAVEDSVLSGLEPPLQIAWISTALTGIGIVAVFGI